MIAAAEDRVTERLLIRTRAAIIYALGGDQRFLSHHDEQRMLTRALRRAAWPLAFSQGFNPHPKLTLPLPRPVGVASGCQLALVELEGDVSATVLHDALSRAIVRQIEILRIIWPATRGTPQATQIVYEMPLDAADLAAAEAGIARVRAARQIVIERKYGPGKPSKPVDIRSFLTNLNLDGALLRMHVACDGQATARPSEIVSAIGLSGDTYNHRAERVDVTWNIELAAPEGSRGDAPERTDLGKKEDHDDA